MRPVLPPTRVLPPILALLVAFSLTGCVSSGYQRAAKSTPPAIPLGWQSATFPVDLTLQTVIVYQGPGSWKANAYFDEYVVTLRNTSSSPQSVTRALLTDFRGSTVATGDNPWTLEKLSRTKLDRFGSLAAIGAGTALTTFGAGLGTFATLAFGPAGLTAGMSLGSAFMLISGAMVAVPVATVYKNVSSKHGIEAEFTRRQLRLPLTLKPGQELTGSLFFPVTPGPRQLQVQLEGQSLLDAVALPLPQLAALHLAPDPDAIPLRPIYRNGRHYLTLKLDTARPNGRIAANGELLGFSPSRLEVEVDADGFLMKAQDISAMVEATRYFRGLQSRIVLPAGQIPPAKVEFDDRSVRLMPFIQTEPALQTAP